MSFTIGVVCTGNLCRSPAAELLMRATLPDQQAVRLWSAGTHARPGQRLDPTCAAILAEQAVDPSHHRARRLSSDDLADADLVLCAALEHRAAVLALAPRLMRRTFTMVEFAELSRQLDRLNDAALPPSGAAGDDARRAIVRAVADQRGARALACSAQGPGPGDATSAYDIPDPLGAPYAEVQAVLSRIGALCTQIGSTLRLGSVEGLASR